MGEWVNWG